LESSISSFRWRAGEWQLGAPGAGEHGRHTCAALNHRRKLMKTFLFWVARVVLILACIAVIALFVYSVHMQVK
jgi:hypothetical protein